MAGAGGARPAIRGGALAFLACFPCFGVFAGLCACGQIVGADFDDWQIDVPAEAGPPKGDADAIPDAALPDGPLPEDPEDASSDALPDGGCADGRTRCGDLCFDTSTHDSHCGGCGIACKADENCIAGKCKRNGVFSSCRTTPATCNAVCQSLGQVCSSTCGPSGDAFAAVYGEFDFTCSGQGVALTGAQCAAVVSEDDHGSLRCCCAPP